MIVLGAPSYEGIQKGISWMDVEARMASGPVAVGKPPVPSSEASTEMCCGRHLGDYHNFFVSHQKVISTKADAFSRLE